MSQTPVAPPAPPAPTPPVVYRLAPAGEEGEWPCEGGLAGYDSEDEARQERWIAAQKRRARAEKKREASEKKRRRFEADLAAAYSVVSQLKAGRHAAAGEPAPKKRNTAKSKAK